MTGEPHGGEMVNVKKPDSRRGVLALLLVGVLASAGCLERDGDGPDWSDPERIAYASSLSIDLTRMTKTASGLFIQDLEVGEGPEALVTDTVEIHYVGWIPDGRAFDSSGSGAPARFALQDLIPGWQEGVPGMQPGGVRLLVIPPALAYGNNAVSIIPRNSTIIFEVQLLGIVPR